jgi:hypothetical protein
MEHREQRDERARPEGRGVLLLEIDLGGGGVLHVGGRLQGRDERLVGDGADGLALELGLAGVRVVDREGVLPVLDVDLLDVPLLDLFDEIAEGDGLLPIGRAQKLPDREEHHDQENPEKERLVRLLHVDLSLTRRMGPGAHPRKSEGNSAL